MAYLVNEYLVKGSQKIFAVCNYELDLKEANSQGQKVDDDHYLDRAKK